MGYIYKSTSPTGEIYIGQTINTIKKRWDYHLYKASYGSNMIISQNIRRFGSDAFTIEMLEEAPNDKLNELEIEYISANNSIFPNGLNFTRGGGAQSLETRIQNSDSHRIHTIEEMELPLNVRAIVIEGTNNIIGFRVDIPGAKKAYSFRDSNMTLQEKYDLVIKQYQLVLDGKDDHTENRKKKIVDNDLPLYIYWDENKHQFRVKVPGFYEECFSNTKFTKEQRKDQAIKARNELLSGIKIQPERSDEPREYPPYIHWRAEKKQASFKHPHPSTGMKTNYSKMDASKTKDELLTIVIQWKEDILSGFKAEEIDKTKASAKAKANDPDLVTNVCWDPRGFATFTDPRAKKDKSIKSTHIFGLAEYPTPKACKDAAKAKKFELLGK